MSGRGILCGSDPWVDSQDGNSPSLVIGDEVLKPYIIDTGPNSGLTAAILLLARPFEFFRLYNFYLGKYGKNYRRRNGTNRLYNDILRVLEQTRQFDTVQKCRFCNGKQNVTKFALRGGSFTGYSFSSFHTCCNNEDCEEKLKEQGADRCPQIFGIDFKFFTYPQKRGEKIKYPNEIVMLQIFNEIFPAAYGYEVQEFGLDEENRILRAEEILYRL